MIYTFPEEARKNIYIKCKVRGNKEQKPVKWKMDNNEDLIKWRVSLKSLKRIEKFSSYTAQKERKRCEEEVPITSYERAITMDTTETERLIHCSEPKMWMSDQLFHKQKSTKLIYREFESLNLSLKPS
jgi:hypothetical protein